MNLKVKFATSDRTSPAAISYRDWNSVIDASYLLLLEAIVSNKNSKKLSRLR